MVHHILVVDDDAMLRDTVRAILAAEGYATESAADGREALARVQEQPPALVLLDLQMPELTGQETLAGLRQRPEHIPVVFMTAGLRAQTKAARCGADDYLVKPFEIEQLLAVVERHCA